MSQVSAPTSAEHVVVDASVMVDLVARTADRFPVARSRLTHTVMHAPGHFDAEVLSALGRMHRSGVLTRSEVDSALDELRQAPVTRHELPSLLTGAWTRRDTLRLTDALYVELADSTGMVLLTTDHRLGRACPVAEVLT